MNILTLCALLLVPASPTPVSAPPAHMAAATISAAVVVKIGEASREEYKHGDPANCVSLLRSN